MLPSARGGVPTAMKTTSERATASAVSVVNESRPAADVARDEVVETRLVDRDLAAPSDSIFSASLSTQITCTPNSAKQAPVTRPT